MTDEQNPSQPSGPPPDEPTRIAQPGPHGGPQSADYQQGGYQQSGPPPWQTPGGASPQGGYGQGAPGQAPYGGPPATAGMPPMASPMGHGPIGETQANGMLVLLSIVTCGIYYLIWVFKKHEEMKNFAGDGLGGGIALVIALFAGLVSPFLMSNEVEKIYQRLGRESPVSAVTGCWILLPFVGVYVWQVKTNEALNQLWQSLGAPPPA